MILCIDGYNFIHRARSGFTLGDFPVVFNFFRNFRALIEMHKPSRVYFVLEGMPRQRLAAMPEYKANRVIDTTDTKEVSAWEAFQKQKSIIIAVLRESFPVSVVHHMDFECDDVIYNLIRRSTEAVPWIVASNDSDFTQLLNEFSNVQVYNPMLKTFVEAPPYDYVTWKSLRGDGSDNIPGIPGVGDKTALELVNDPDALERFFNDPEKGPARKQVFERNYPLIKFHTWSDDDALQMTSSSPVKDWDKVKELFNTCDFKSLLKENTWQKFQATFDPLWG